ncbi:hypothetical protein [Nostoc sp.]|uniref:hypothetical protein n=1 Tax=Nostoc sp. TaxID=1180 RepID=UPI002FFB2FED
MSVKSSLVPPPSMRSHQAILKATWDLCSGSWECISIEAIAARAGVGKPYSIIQKPKLIHLYRIDCRLRHF